MTSRLILIGRAIEHFDNAEYVNKKMSLTFKYLLIRDSNRKIKMLIHFAEEPTKEHSDAIEYYMAKNNLRQLTIKGGGNVTFRAGYYKRIIFSKASGIFAWYTKNEIKKIAEKIWPDFDLQFTDITHDKYEVEVNLKDWYLESIKSKLCNSSGKLLETREA